ncbi:MAG: c-type cytochrome [Caldimonas sp.]|uniref:c-type cytochrome n=1 Tax=Caldimonas sp. TaxID=2838790 RepID=UPI00391B840E
MSATTPFLKGLRRLGTLLCMAGFAAQAQPIDRPDPASMTARVQACVACHGAQGRATREGYFPRIAGKPALYQYHQLLHFRDGRRRYGAMSHLLQHLTDDYLREIAGHFAALDLPYPPTPAITLTPTQRARGEQLVRVGDAGRGIPACASCHGQALLGIAPALPGLLGLPRDYLNAQLGAWRVGTRRAFEPDCMARIAKALDEQDISAVSGWLANQPLPAPALPEPALTRPLPIDCGGVPAPQEARR